MKLKEIIRTLEEFCPSGFAMSWDNVGLLVGSSDQEIGTIALALDATSSVIDKAAEEGADLLLTHHPLLFSAVNKISDSDFVGKRILKLIRGNIACYAMHTNFDVLGMADAAADLLHLTDREVLEITYEDEISVDGLGRIGSLIEPLSLSEYASKVGEVFGIEHVRYYGNPEETIVTCCIGSFSRLSSRPSSSSTQATPPLMPAAKLSPTGPSTATRPPVMYSQPWSPTPSTTAHAPELRTAKRSPAMPATKAYPLVAPYSATLPIRVSSFFQMESAGGHTASVPPERPLPR